MKKFLIGILIIAWCVLVFLELQRYYVGHLRHAFYSGYLAGMRRHDLMVRCQVVGDDVDIAWERYKE